MKFIKFLERKAIHCHCAPDHPGMELSEGAETGGQNLGGGGGGVQLLIILVLICERSFSSAVQLSSASQKACNDIL